MKLHHCLPIALCMGILFSSCQKEPEPVKVTGVSLNTTSITLTEGETQSLTATVSPNDAANKVVIWSTNNSAIATVDNKGMVKGISAGTATITAKSDDGGKTATCSVTVKSKIVAVTSVSLDKSSLELTVGGSETLTASVSPDDATDKTVTWSSSDASVATVQDGKVSALKLGTATITVKTNDGGKTASCSVTVKPTEVTSVELDKSSVSLKAGETVTLTATVKPDDATDKKVTWTSSDESVATVADGKITAVKVGSASITAKAGDKTATCAVTVEPTEVTEVSLNKTSINLKVGGTATLTATVKPDDATDKTVTWSSSNETIATVDKEGVVTAVKVGACVVTAKSHNGKTAKCEVTVEPTDITSVTLDKTNMTVKAGESQTLTATVKPDDATDKTVTWITSDSAIATVEKGKVTGVAPGTATITAKAGDKTATCKVTVEKVAVTTVTISKDAITLKVGGTETLTAAVKPDNATYKEITWSSADASIATVKNGVVTAVKVGKTTVKATADGKSAICTVTVEPTDITSITLDKTSVTLKAGETATLTATVKPDNATDKTVTWSTSDASVATVSNGVITAVEAGSAVITAKAGGKTATCSVTVAPTAVESVSLDKTTVSFKVGESETLVATVKPDKATDKTVSWSSSDASVVTVSGGTITAMKEGTATITVKTNDGGKTATCSVTVVPTPVSSVTLDKTTLSLAAGESSTIIATVNPETATDKTVTWSSSDEAVATVTGGTVKAVKIGSATITAKAGEKSATCQVTVVATPVTSITLDMTSGSLKVGEQLTLTATVKPDNASDKSVTWSSSDGTVATVKDGVVTAVKVGTATITAKAGEKTATCNITVIPTPVESVSLDKISASLKAGEKVTLTATVKPDDATDKSVTWSTSDASVATVKDGVVTAVKVGSATITAKTNDGSKTATCSITVIPTPVESVSLDKTSVEVSLGDMVTLAETVNPSDATDKTVTWSSSDATVASVSGGKVKALKAGNATITVKTNDGAKTATCSVTVKAKGGSSENYGKGQYEW